MPDDMEKVLRNALDAVDRGRRWATLGVAALFVATVMLLFAAFHAGQAGSQPGSSKELFLAVAAQMLFVACCTATVMFHVTRMTKSVLRAVELTRRG